MIDRRFIAGSYMKKSQTLSKLQSSDLLQILVKIAFCAMIKIAVNRRSK